MDLRKRFFLFLALEILAFVILELLPPLSIFNDAYVIVILIPAIFTFIFSGTELDNQFLLYQFLLSIGLFVVWGMYYCGSNDCESPAPVIVPFFIFGSCVLSWAIGRTIWKGSIWPKKDNK